MTSLPNNFPKELLHKGYSLKQNGVNEIAWKKVDAYQVIEFLMKSGYAILGGDVYTKEGGNFIPTYDSWFINKQEKISWENFILKSKEKALAYIEHYYSVNGSDYLYVLVFSQE
jgi:hypothetical protein